MMLVHILAITVFCMATTGATGTADGEAISPKLPKTAIIDLVNRVCAPERYICPALEFGIFGKIGEYAFDFEAILKSPETEVLRAGVLPMKDVAKYVQSSFCCMEGDCLHRCGIYPITEHSLVRNFPKNLDLIFSLGLPEIEKFRLPIMRYLKKTNGKLTRPYPAEIEEYFDEITENAHKIAHLARKEVGKERNGKVGVKDLLL